MNLSSFNKIPSVKRRYTGPYLPCPRPKRVALDSKQDQKNTTSNDNADEKNTKSDDDPNNEECIDFAVEKSPKKNTLSTNAKNTTNDVEVIESDEDVQIIQPRHDIEEINYPEEELQPEAIEISNGVDEVEELPQQIRNFVEIPDDPVEDPDQDQETSIDPIESIPSSSEMLQNESGGNTKSIVLKDCTCPNTSQRSSQGRASLPQELSPQVCLVPLRQADCLQQHDPWTTYTVFGFKLRSFCILIKDCCQVSNSIMRTPPKNLIASNTFRKETVSTPEFTEKYEDRVAEKLLTLRKKLDTPEKRLELIERNPIKNSLVSDQAHKSTLCVIIDLEESTEKRPVHPRNRLRLSPIKSPTLLLSTRLYSSMMNPKVFELSDDSDSDSSSIIETEDDEIIIKAEDGDYVTLSSDSQNEIKTEEEYDDSDADDGDDEYSILSNADDEMSDVSELIQPKIEVKSEVKQEEDISTEPSCYVSDDDLDNLLDAYHQVKRNRTRQQISIQTFNSNSVDVKPSLINKSPLSTHISSSTCKQQKLSRSRSSSKNPKKREPKNKTLIIQVVKLSRETIGNLIELCTFVPNWNNNELLKGAGLASFDIDRLGLIASSRQNSNYRLRQFVKRKKIYEENVNTKEKSKQLSFSKKSPRLGPKDLQKLKRKMKKKEKEERKQMERDSIRRALLKINNRVLNQNKFWGFLNKGASESCPIVL